MAAAHAVFFSYRRKDLSRAQPLLDALNAAGVRVWRDEDGLRDLNPITPEIRNAIASSKALIAFYSADYPLSHACFEELRTAWIAAEQAGELPYSRVFVVNPESGFDHIARALQEQQSFRWQVDAAGFEDVAGRIGAKLEPLTGTLHHAASPARPMYHGMSAIAAARFEGRSRELWDLHGQLTADRMSIITGVFGQASAQVRGMGGNGKSMLAREYAIRFGAAYPGGVFWVSAYGNDDSKGALDETAREALRRDQVRDFAVRCGVVVEGLNPEQIEAAFWEALGERKGRCLWIVDDLPSGLPLESVQNRWAPRWGGAALMITTRSSEYRALGGAGIDLEMLSEEEAFRLLTWRRPPLDAGGRDAARAIVRELGRHPLAVEVAGCYLGRGFDTYAGYLAALASPDSDAVEFGARLKEALPTGHQRGISATLLRSVAMLAPDGRAFLELASVLAVAPVPRSLVEAAFRHWPEPRPDPVAGMDDADSLGLAKSDGGDARIVHTLVSRAVRRSAGNPGADPRPAAAALQPALRALLELLPPPAADIRRHGEIRRELVHARYLIAAGLNDEQTINVAEWVARQISSGAISVPRGSFRSRCWRHAGGCWARSTRTRWGRC